MTDSLLFSPVTIGPLQLKNRVVMAPMTRSRALGNVPNELMAQYYGQRTEAGLIVTEGTAPSPNGLGYARIPGLFNDAQVAGWKLVTQAVHRDGTRIFAQLMHTGRVGHPGNLPAGARLLGPSAVAWESQMWVDGQGQQPVPVAEAMSEADIEEAIESFASAAERAVAAGFDGIELHGANGYLIEQFLNTASNQRTDAWGGTVEGRIRFAVEVAKRVAARIGGQRVGIRVSPYGAASGMTSNDVAVEEVHEALAGELSKIGLLYMHVVDHSALGAPAPTPSVLAKIRAAFSGSIILAGGFDKARAEAELAERHGDLIAFGRPFLSNPHLVTKLKTDAALTPPDLATFYTPGEKGYTDYPL
jgi:N-ethylmaleimide reductase